MKDLHFEKISPIAAPARDLYAWHTRPGAFTRLIPPWQEISLPAGGPTVRNGAQVRIRMKRGPLTLSWLAEHRNVRPGESFEDFQVSGPFGKWEHLHEFRPAVNGSILRDSIHYRPPGGALGAAVLGGSIRADIERTFAYRHRTTAADLALHAGFAGRSPLTVAITGASGLVGESLSALLTTGGHRVLRLVRRPSDHPDAVEWRPEIGIVEPGRLEGIDAVVHLAGENIGSGRWTKRKRERILTSRVQGTRSLIQSLAVLDAPPNVFLGASAVGVYGDRGSQLLDERNAPGDGFLADVCAQWEDAVGTAGELGSRVAMLRFGVIVSPRGGMLAKLLPPFRAGLGGVVGSGEQYLSWVSIDDAISAALFTLQRDDLEGPINVVAPHPVTNRGLTRRLGDVLQRPTILPMPAPLARAAFGQMADEMLLASTRVVPTILQDAGFGFRHQRLEDALAHLLGR